MTIWRPMRNLLIAFPEELIIALDEMAKDQWFSRSECIRRILLEATEKYRIETSHNRNNPSLFDLDDS